MDVRLPPNMPPEQVEKIKEDERNYSQSLQRDGKWPHIWRVAGQYSNYSVLEVSDNDELHGLISGLPLFPYMGITVTPLAQHPSAITRTARRPLSK